MVLFRLGQRRQGAADSSEDRAVWPRQLVVPSSWM